MLTDPWGVTTWSPTILAKIRLMDVKTRSSDFSLSKNDDPSGAHITITLSRPNDSKNM